jgi:hypothetical protein
MSRMWAKTFFGNISPDDCELLILPDGDQADQHLAYYAEMRRYLQHEDELINSRLTLSLTVHGFLFAAYGLILGKALDFGGELSKSATLTSSQPIPLMIVLFSLLILVAMTGATVGLFSRNAIRAGFNAIQHVNTVVHLEEPLKVMPPSERRKMLLACALQGSNCWLLPTITSGGAPPERVEGAFYYYCWLPMLLCAVWILLTCIAVYLCIVWRPASQPQRTIYVDLPSLTVTRTPSTQASLYDV